VDIPVILLPSYILGLDQIRKLEKAGRQPWYYICCAPGGHWPNRFLDFSLMKTRVLHWINFFYGAPGYLHWGYNYWAQPDPFLEFSPAWFGEEYRLPPGDTHVVYPGPDGPVNSLRFDTQRDSAEDYELLRLLAERDPEKARSLAEKIIRRPFDPGDLPDRFDWDIANFRAVRRELLESFDGPTY